MLFGDSDDRIRLTSNKEPNMKKIALAVSLAMAAQPTTVQAAKPDFPAYHGSKDEPFNWCAWFDSNNLTAPYRIFCIQRI